VASARPFVPEVAASSRGAIRGEIPMPEGRPYDLGNTSGAMAAIPPATSEMPASRRARSAVRMPDNPRAVSYDNDPRYAPSTDSGESPSDARGASGVLSARGLY
jgi:rare lipoprotein A